MTPLLAGAPQAIIREFSQQRAQRGRYVSSAAADTAGRSVRFNSADSAYLSRTPASAGNRRTWTWSGWVKKVKNVSILPLLNARQSYSDFMNVWFDSGNGLFVQSRVGDANTFYAYTTAVFRDPSAWYHVLIAVDTTQASDSNGIKVYINGTQQTLTIPTYNQNENTYVNSTYEHRLGYLINQNSSTYYLDSYLADLHLIDGQALTPSSFGETDATTGQWIAKDYSGSYGTNGFFLDFADNSTAAALGYDAAGSNDWTVNSLSVTAGSGNDSLRDHPTSAGTSTGAGGEVSGNYCTWNPLFSSGTSLGFSEGNLKIATSSSTLSTIGTTIAFPTSGKWYVEVTKDSGTYMMIGVIAASASLDTSTYLYQYSESYVMYNISGALLGTNSGSSTGSGATFGNGDVIGIALDLDNRQLRFWKNGTQLGGFNSVTNTNQLMIAMSDHDSSSTTATLNTGQRAFAYSAPSGFSPLVDTLLPTPTIGIGSTVMDVKLYTGNGSTQTISGLNFSPDLVWTKSRSLGEINCLSDTVRGAAKQLHSELNSDESSNAQSITAFNSDGYSLGNQARYNSSGATYVSWNWDAGSSTVANTQGSITSQVRANPSSGFSVLTYTGTGSNATVGHGLGIAPALVIVKSRTISGRNWAVLHQSLPNTQYLWLNSTLAATTGATYWNSTSPTSNVFSIGTSVDTNAIHSAQNYVAYCWAPVAGYSAFGSYTGNGSTDGTFVYTGFRPRWLMIKSSSTGGAGYNWVIHDTARDTYNLAERKLYANLSLDEVAGSNNQLDILSNGFKLKSTNTATNSSSVTYVYAAYAEAPFPYARAR